MELATPDQVSQDSSTPGDPQPRPAGWEPIHLSPSGAGLFKQCPTRWKYRYVDQLPDPPGIPALVGTFAHRVLELLLQEPPDDRTPDRAKEIASEVWPETVDHADFVALELDDDAQRAFKWKGWEAINGLWDIEDPAEIDVDSTEHGVQVTIGGVPFRGIVDRIDLGDDGKIISDYKSGSAPRPRYEADKLSQVMLYAAAVEAETGDRPTEARLLYLGQRVIGVKVTEKSIAKAVTDLREIWDRVLSSCKASQFDISVGPLCGWCPYVERCQAGSDEVRRLVRAGRMRPDAPAVALVAAAETTQAQ
ncbi:MAG: RecB family exonuclease [Acidimicrobiales bacterium]